MAITVNKKLGSTWHTPTSEKESEEPAKFKIKQLNGEQLDDALNSAVMSDGGTLRLSPAGVRAALKAGIEDWEGINDEDGTKLKCTHVNHRFLPWSLRQELAGEIINQSMLSEEDSKNS